VVELAVIGDFVLRPERLDQFDLFTKPGHARGDRNLKVAVMVLPAEANRQNRPSSTGEIQRRPLMRHHQWAVDRQHHHRRADPDAARERGRVGQDHDGIEARPLVHGVFRDPEVGKPQLLGPASDGRDRRHRQLVV